MQLGATSVRISVSRAPETRPTAPSVRQGSFVSHGRIPSGFVFSSARSGCIPTPLGPVGTVPTDAASDAPREGHIAPTASLPTSSNSENASSTAVGVCFR